MTLLRYMVASPLTASPSMLAIELGLLLKRWRLVAIEVLPEEVQKVKDGNYETS